MKLVHFNFETKTESSLSIDDLESSLGEHEFYWLVLEETEIDQARQALKRLGADAFAVDDFLGKARDSRYDFHEDALLFSLAEASFVDGELRTSHLQCLRGPHFLAVLKPAQSEVMDTVLQIYSEDFQKFARSDGFLIYELASVLLESYRRSFHNVTDAVEALQLKLFGEVSDTIFSEVSRLTANILAFRRMVFGSRDLFDELATRKSQFISRFTQPTLKTIAARMERLGDDLDSERSVMTETLNLYMGMVSHRTNRIINRLTIFSMIFLPLSFLCGVYGMNFEFMPELQWRPAYFVFWGVVATFVVSFITLIRKKNWL